MRVGAEILQYFPTPAYTAWGNVIARITIASLDANWERISWNKMFCSSKGSKKRHSLPTLVDYFSFSLFPFFYFSFCCKHKNMTTWHHLQNCHSSSLNLLISTFLPKTLIQMFIKAQMKLWISKRSPPTATDLWWWSGRTVAQLCLLFCMHTMLVLHLLKLL